MSTVPVTFKASPLPQNFAGTPQQLQDAIVARLSIEPQNAIAFFSTGSVAPSSNTGPWLKNGITWYVWDVGTGAYVPETLESQSLAYIAQMAAPDPAIYTFWIVLDGSGVAQSIKTYSGGAWNDVYASTFANIYTKSQTDAAIAAAVAAGQNAGSASFGVVMTASQNIVFAAPGEQTPQLVWGTEQYDPDSVFSGNVFAAPKTGLYTFKLSAYLSVTAGAPTGNSIALNLTLNGNPAATALQDTSSANARIISLCKDLQLNAGDLVGGSIDITVGGSTGTWTVNSTPAWTYFSGFRVR